MLECRIYCTIFQKRNIHTNFYEGFATNLNEDLTHVVFFHAACWPFYGCKQSHTLFDVAKKTLLSENTYDMLTRAGPKTLPKKVLKNSFGGPF